jgi:hypothetical protein
MAVKQLRIKNGGNWQNAGAVYSKISGSWVPMQKAWVKESGVWQLVWEWVFEFNIETTTQLNVRSAAVAAGWNESASVIANIVSGAIISGNNNSGQACVIDGDWPNGILLNNYGNIIGWGGPGGSGGSSSASATNNGSNGSNGRAGLSVGAALTGTLFVNNQGTIAGGGGGGGGGAGAYGQYFVAGSCNKFGCWPATLNIASAGGGGGGAGRSSNNNASGGSAGSASGGTNQANRNPAAANGGTGTFSSNGGGGSGDRHRPFNNDTLVAHAGSGGNGGGWGSNGSGGGNTIGFAGVNQNARWRSGGGGGAAGLAVWGNSRITWINTGTRLGGISAG